LPVVSGNGSREVKLEEKEEEEKKEEKEEEGEEKEKSRMTETEERQSWRGRVMYLASPQF
jgi:hypothetical protein